MKLSKKEKEILLELLNKENPPSKNLVKHQIVFKKKSNLTKTAINLHKKGLVGYVGIGLISDVIYLTAKGLQVAISEKEKLRIDRLTKILDERDQEHKLAS